MYIDVLVGVTTQATNDQICGIGYSPVFQPDVGALLLFHV
jgi:hypothetical protein